MRVKTQFNDGSTVFVFKKNGKSMLISGPHRIQSTDVDMPPLIPGKVNTGFEILFTLDNGSKIFERDCCQSLAEAYKKAKAYLIYT